MIPADALKAVDVLLRDITQVNRPFGGKYMFLGGDFRQVLPVVPRAGREGTVRQCIKYSHLWAHSSLSTGYKHESHSRSNIQTVF